MAEHPPAPASVKALRCAPSAYAARKGRAALTDASAACGCWSSEEGLLFIFEKHEGFDGFSFAAIRWHF